jgi:hypothetical protein
MKTRNPRTPYWLRHPIREWYYRRNKPLPRWVCWHGWDWERIVLLASLAVQVGIIVVAFARCLAAAQVHG